MKVLSAFIVGLLSAILVSLMAAPFVDTLFKAALKSTEPGPFLTLSFVWVVVTILIPWIVTTTLVLRGADSASRVWARGGLIGAAEWMILGIGLFLAQFWYSAIKHEEAGLGAVISGGLGMFILVIATFMALISLLIWFIASRIGAEFQSGDPADELVPCPQCAERIQSAARKCRFCGFDIPARRPYLFEGR